jgi:hypothetical protein
MTRLSLVRTNPISMDAPKESGETNKGPKGLLSFVLATLCVVPFVGIAVLMMAALFAGKQILSGPLMASAFLLPLLLILTICELISSIFAWKNSPRYCRPILCGYWLSTILYWGLMIGLGPW